MQDNNISKKNIETFYTDIQILKFNNMKIKIKPLFLNLVIQIIKLNNM